MTQVDDICRQLDPGLRRDDDMADSPPSGPAKRGCVLWVILGGGGPRSGGEGENCGKSIRVKIAKARVQWDGPRFYLLQENQGFFATHFFTKMKNFFGGFLRFFDF